MPPRTKRPQAPTDHCGDDALLFEHERPQVSLVSGVSPIGPCQLDKPFALHSGNHGIQSEGHEVLNGEFADLGSPRCHL